MSKYEHAGFGVLEEIRLEDIVCETFKVCSNPDDEDNEIYEFTLYSDVRGVPIANQARDKVFRMSCNADEWREFQRNGVTIGPLRVYETIEHGVAIEFCGCDALSYGEPITEAELLRCIEWLNLLKAHGRVPASAKMRAYTWF